MNLMPDVHMKARRNTILLSLFAVTFIFAARSLKSAQSDSKSSENQACSTDESGLSLPGGFCATVFADGIGHARHMVVAPDGVLYVNTWSGRYYGNDTPPPGGFLLALQDKNGAGKADVIERFGETVESSGAGGTGMWDL